MIFPGTNLSFSQGKAGLVPTKGRSLDHIGFDVKDLEAFTKKLDAQGDQARRGHPPGSERDDQGRVSDRPVGHAHRADPKSRAQCSAQRAKRLRRVRPLIR